jgi:MFS transporter, DHA2 family, methylenomycin A resistance protein
MRSVVLRSVSLSSAGASSRAAKGVSRSTLTQSLTLVAMSLGYGVVQLDVTIVNTALTSIGGSLGGDVTALQWVVSAYTISFAACILTAGALSDRLGAKIIFMTALRYLPSLRLAVRWRGAPPR